jgi:Na+/H+ antiporter NhaB
LFGNGIQVLCNAVWGDLYPAEQFEIITVTINTISNLISVSKAEGNSVKLMDGRDIASLI